MKYNPELGLMGNIKSLFNEETKTKNGLENQKSKEERDMLDILASDVQAVEDKFNAIVEE